MKNRKMEPKYVWKNDKGTIVEGQGTPSITVNTSGLDKTTIVVSLNIIGLPRTCSSSFVGEGKVHRMIRNCDNFGFGEMPDNDVRARLDSAFAELMNSPSQKLYVVT